MGARPGRKKSKKGSKHDSFITPTFKKFDLGYHIMGGEDSKYDKLLNQKLPREVNRAGSDILKPLAKVDKKINPLRQVPAVDELMNSIEAKPGDAAVVAIGSVMSGGAMAGAGTSTGAGAATGASTAASGATSGAATTGFWSGVGDAAMNKGISTGVNMGINAITGSGQQPPQQQFQQMGVKDPQQSTQMLKALLGVK